MLTNAKTNKKDVMLTLVFFSVIIAGLKFLFEGVNLTILGHAVNLGHTDASTYAAFLTPVLGSHSYIDAQTPHLPQPPKADNPDEN